MMQRLIQTIYPPSCVMCDAMTDVDFALCGPCWADTPFITGLCCDACGCPLPGQGVPDPSVLCDDCMVTARPWAKGRAALAYRDKARHMVLAIKHGDRTDLARAVAPWMARAGADIITLDSLLVPIPLHRFRLLKRRYNQAALLAQQIGQIAGVDCCPDALVRPRKTAPLEHHNHDQRFAVLDDSIAPHPKRHHHLMGRDVVLVDDVMTSGATFAAATQACFAAGAKNVHVLALARVVKDT